MFFRKKKSNNIARQPPVVGITRCGRSMVIRQIENNTFEAFKEFFDSNGYDFGVWDTTKSGVTITCQESCYILYCEQQKTH